MDGNHGEIHPTSADYVDDGIPFVMATDIFNGQVYLNKSKKIPKTQADSLRKGFSLEGDILLTHKATIGNVAIVPKLNTPYVMLTPQVTYYRILNKEKLVPEFLKSNFESPYFQNELLALCTGATRLYIGISEQRKIPFRYCCTEEQTKIASFLSAVDEKISQLTQKHALLSQYKQGMMQKLFSQQIRFKADDGSDFEAWEEKKLGEISSKVGSGSTPRGGAEAYTDKGIIFIRSQNVNNNQLFLDDVVFIPKETHKKMSGSKVSANDILLNITGASIGRSCTVPSDFIEANVNQHVCIIRTPKDNPKFIQAFLSSKAGQDLIESYQTGSGREGLNFQSIRSFELNLPCLEEQTKIANFLSAIDQKIEVVAQQIEQAKTWKKGLLQQMFV
ncbi:restriction endonuclease subunit S [Acinetobacter bohemicus]|uniref:Type I restriction enzyme, S subunit n=1 Tax=Acinetobacter bohemicus TaxID=1435036 RepID=A0A1I6W6V7_9GAMM|nr:restriction endonuclease subunit S [Acinetobacter bohemicus]KAB0650381.1 restriction endonuclease subunit S [Acinetobacter bohemicus]SFT21709.1 type I restriction enzyme, S subunit [Acinetobacter bohemicus]